MEINLRLFSIARDLAGFTERKIEVPDHANAAAVYDILNELNVKFVDWRSSLRLAVNEEYVSSDHPLNDGDEVAVIPPVSGG